MLGTSGQNLLQRSPLFIRKSKNSKQDRRSEDLLVSPLNADECATPAATRGLNKSATGSSTVDSGEDAGTEYTDLGSVNAKPSATEVTRAEFERLVIAQEQAKALQEHTAALLTQMLSNQTTSQGQETVTPTPTKGAQSLTSRHNLTPKDRRGPARAPKWDPSDGEPSSEDTSEEESERANSGRRRRTPMGGRMSSGSTTGRQDVNRVTVANVQEFVQLYGYLKPDFKLDDLVRMDMHRKRYREEYGISTMWDSIVEPEMRAAIQARAQTANSTTVGGTKMKVCYPERLTNAGFLRALFDTIAPRSEHAYHKMLVDAVRWKKPLPTSVSISKWPSFHCQLIEHILHFNMCYAWLRRDFEAEEKKSRNIRSGKDPKMVISEEPGDFELPFYRQEDSSLPLSSIPKAEQSHCSSLLSVFFSSIPKAPAAGGADSGTFDLLLMIHNQLRFVDKRTPKKDRLKGDVVLQDIDWPKYTEMFQEWLINFKEVLESIRDPLTVLTAFNTQLREGPRPEAKAASLGKRRTGVVAALELMDDEKAEQLGAAMQATPRGGCKHRYCPQMRMKDICEYGEKCIFSHEMSVLESEIDTYRKHIQFRESAIGSRAQPTLVNSRRPELDEVYYEGEEDTSDSDESWLGALDSARTN
jgi:hypothetical protein